jgi:hypothetical protein
MEGSMLLRVQYQDERFDYVQAAALDGLIVSGRVKKLYRPLDGEWATIGVDAVRGSGGSYSGTDRRQSESYPES